MKRILGIDYGDKRIGIAISDPMCIIATALDYIRNDDNTIDKILKLTKIYDVEMVVVGLPLNLKGERGAKSIQVYDFIQNLKQKTDLKVVEWDERFTTKIARQTIMQMGLKKKQRQDKSKIDSMAATILLQSFLDSNYKLKNEK